jgi:hypothetical protein
VSLLHIDEIRHLLTPDRLERRGRTAPNRPHTRGTVDGTPFVYYPSSDADRRLSWAETNDRVVRARQAHEARTTGRILAVIAPRTADVIADQWAAYLAGGDDQ